ncbi:uncharacterized protein DS421_8g242670 [Arachis hypogaea]|nr:uncharacterized protein DS421_8g242670 [Arachis hypogaea]
MQRSHATREANNAKEHKSLSPSLVLMQRRYASRGETRAAESILRERHVRVAKRSGLTGRGLAEGGEGGGRIASGDGVSLWWSSPRVYWSENRWIGIFGEGGGTVRLTEGI